MGNSIKISIHLDHENAAQPHPSGKMRATTQFSNCAWCICAHRDLTFITPAADGTFGILRAGEPLLGTVIIQVKKRVKGDLVKIVASGKKTVYTRRKKKRPANEHNVLNVEAKLSDMRNQWVQPGNYSFQFRIDMPDSLPSSMSWDDKRHGCSVRYKISAGMGKHTTDDMFFRVASAPMSDVKVPCFIEPKTETIKSLGFLNTGSVTFGASVNNTQAGRGQEIDISFACVNNTTIEIRSVEIKLVELITYSTREQSYVRKIPLLVMKNVEMPGLRTEKTSREMILQNQRSPNAAHITSCDQIYQALTSTDNGVRITIPKVRIDRVNKVGHHIG